MKPDEILKKEVRTNGNPTSEISPKTIARIVTAAIEYGVRKVKFSGGEPLMRNDFEEIIAGLPELKDMNLLKT